MAQANEFTVIPVNVFIPALRPCATKDNRVDSGVSCLSGTGCKVAVPYSFDSTQWANIPVVATDRYAFWITNPSMAMYEAMNLWCNGKQGKLAFQADSSYSSIQVWRFDPYQFCPLDTRGERRCPQDTSATSRVLPGFISQQDESVCTQRFYVLAPTISYIDEDNLAITVMETTFQNLDLLTLRPVNASLARSRGPPPQSALACARPLMHVDPQRPKHLLDVVGHAVMFQDLRVHPVQPLHACARVVSLRKWSIGRRTSVPGRPPFTNAPISMMHEHTQVCQGQGPFDQQKG